MSVLERLKFLKKVFFAPKVNFKEPCESAECIEFMEGCKKLILGGYMRAVVAHVANEYSGDNKPIFGQIQKAMGKIKGFPDYVVLWSDGGGGLEFKFGKGKQSDDQKNVQHWCEEMGVAYDVVYSAQEAFAVIESWGVLSSGWRKYLKRNAA